MEFFSLDDMLGPDPEPLSGDASSKVPVGPEGLKVVPMPDPYSMTQGQLAAMVSIQSAMLMGQEVLVAALISLLSESGALNEEALQRRFDELMTGGETDG